MKNSLTAVIILTLLSFSSCQKEEVIDIPNYDKNWLVVDDDPNDEVVHQTYLFYEKTGIPVYFNDTIGSQQRNDMFGNNFTYYEVLSLNYSLGGVQAGANPAVNSFAYCAKSDVPAALTYLQNEIVPVLPNTVYVPSFLLVESLNSYAFGAYAFKGFNTIVVGQASKIPTMDSETKAKYKGAILRAIFTNSVLDDKYSETLTKFYNASRKFSTSRDIYNLYTGWLSTYVTGLPAGVTPTLQTVGFLGPDPRNLYYTPQSTWMDVCMYLEAILGSSESKFKETYGNYPNIMIKYEYITEILKDIGYKIQ